MRIIAPDNKIAYTRGDKLPHRRIIGNLKSSQYLIELVIEIGKCHTARLFIAHVGKHSLEIAEQSDHFCRFRKPDKVPVRKPWKHVESQTIICLAISVKVVDMYIPLTMKTRPLARERIKQLILNRLLSHIIYAADKACPIGGIVIA